MNDTAFTIAHIGFSPFVPQEWLAFLVLAGAILFGLSVRRSPRGAIIRLLSLAVLLAVLANPVAMEEERKAVRDVAAIIVDKSTSQNFGGRTKTASANLSALSERLKTFPDLDVRIAETDPAVPDTRLFEALNRAFSGTPQQNRAGAFLITDGQVHDVPQDAKNVAHEYGPLHVFLTGQRSERDRQIRITSAPAYAVSGQKARISFEVRDTPGMGEDTAQVTLSDTSGVSETFTVPVNTVQHHDILIDHAGQNMAELRVNTVPGELTPANNITAININGVQDRLRVLLVSGQPNAGGRMWRDFLTSDPGVDLVHFTILREPEKIDMTPPDEMSLIAFPFHELFEVKLKEFDLIIFDRYRLNRILPDYYFENIARYVKEGGAFLSVNGPEFGTEDSIFNTSLQDILPAAPSGPESEAAFIPKLSLTGRQHPVTQNLTKPEDKEKWGKWLRLTPVVPREGDVLLTGTDNNPLLILSRKEKGRVAFLASDHLWLWARGYDGGGPHAELIRRIVHWLMKEPELDEKALDLNAEGMEISVKARRAQGDTLDIAMTGPDGQSEALALKRNADGYFETRVKAGMPGIYAFESSDGAKQYVIAGPKDSVETQEIITTQDKLKPAAQASGGGVFWTGEDGMPSLHMRESKGTVMAGHGWAALRKNGAYDVTGLKARSLFPPWAGCLFILAALLLAWTLEGRRINFRQNGI